MKKIAIVGGHGKISLELTRQLVERGDMVLSAFRNPDHAADIENIGATPLVFDLETSNAAELAKHLEGFDAVVFAAGGGPNSGIERKKTVDRDGSILAADAAQRAGVRHFVQVSAISVDEPVATGTDETWAAYVNAKREADESLRGTSLDWTILRPGALTDDAGTGRIELAEKVERGKVSRQDVAAVIVAVLDEPAARQHTWELVSGDTGVTAAVQDAVSRR